MREITEPAVDQYMLSILPPRDAVMQAVASAGGSDNANWLLDIAKSKTEPSNRRRRAVSLLSRYDDARVKEALKGLINP